MLFVADWEDAIFVHFAIEPAKLAPLIPLELDCLDGRAYVSLVAFTQRNLRPCVGGALAAWLATPLASHEFLNVRTYVRQGDTRGIFFMAEWIPNRLAALIGPRMYGLPYRLGRLRYDGMRREVLAAGRTLLFDCGCAAATQASPLRDDFLLERYTAFTCRRGVIRRFDVDHAPWPQRRVPVSLIDTSLLPLSGDWYRHARLVAAHHSPGARDVSISAPRRIAASPVGGCDEALAARLLR
jgi:uncharacterized protein YqjF (DUF2071 family)